MNWTSSLVQLWCPASADDPFMFNDSMWWTVRWISMIMLRVASIEMDWDSVQDDPKVHIEERGSISLPGDVARLRKGKGFILFKKI